MKDKKRLRNPSQDRGDKGDMATKFNRVSWPRSWGRKGMLGKDWRNLKIGWNLINRNVATLLT